MTDIIILTHIDTYIYFLCFIVLLLLPKLVTYLQIQYQTTRIAIVGNIILLDCWIVYWCNRSQKCWISRPNCWDLYVVLPGTVLYILAWDAAMVTEELHALNSSLVVWNMLQSCGSPRYAALECVEFMHCVLNWEWYGIGLGCCHGNQGFRLCIPACHQRCITLHL